ncbi:hypothetical protein MPL3356_140029 [Mesorhizobium plurifarium]|uniref:Uncharacterized protein n=1 Tax=Mesorhizobium plurifarium TaxID=69974 RepID=A0A090DC55_MESPL|nr:hypothetical protein MPL3356_140029 [Mesorhizobium plurifarium]
MLRIVNFDLYLYIFFLVLSYDIFGFHIYMVIKKYSRRSALGMVLKLPWSAVVGGYGIPPLVLYRGGENLTALAACRQVGTMMPPRCGAPGQ